MHAISPPRSIILALFAVAAGAALLQAQIGGLPPRLDTIKLPPGFKISVFAEVNGARSLSISPSGTVFVGTRDSEVYAVQDRNKDGKGDQVYTIATGLNSPNGVAIRNGALYVAEIHRILRFDDIEKRLASPGRPAIVTDAFPTDDLHGWKFIRFGPDGLLYVPVGAPCNICEPDQRHGAIFRMRPDGTGIETFARGVRNSVGFDWDPATREMWFTDNGRDQMGDDVPNDELNHAPRAGTHFGYPYCHQGSISDPQYGSKRPCSEFEPPVQMMGPHVAALGMRFYTGTMFPPEYRRTVFIAQHGSWNRSEKIGYRVMAARVEGNKVVRFDTFAEGWLQGQAAWGRPVDVDVMADGSLLVSDDEGGRIYRITY